MSVHRNRLIKIFFFLIASAIFLFLPENIFAKRVVTIESYNDTLTGEEQFDVKVGIKGFTEGETIYFKGAFAAYGSTNYFGYTLKDGQWIKNSATATTQLEAIIDGWNRTLTVKPDLNDSGYGEPGDYNFKVGFYYHTTNDNLSSINWSDTVTVTINELLPSPTSTFTPTPSPTPSQTPTSSPTTATYKINEVKNGDGEVLSSVKVYVDGTYLHHYTPETLTFCDGCQCDTYVDCGFGQHEIKLERSDYQDWNESETINSGDSYEVDPVMIAASSDSPTSTPTPTKTPTPASISTSTPTSKPTGTTETPSPGEVLGEKERFPLEGAGEGEEDEETSSEGGKRKVLPFVFLGFGFVFLFGGGFYFWYTQLRTTQ